MPDAPVTSPDFPARPTTARRLQRRHVLMLALAAEILWLGFHNAGRLRPSGILVDQTLHREHIIT